MGQMLGVDYSFSRPAPKDIAAAGYHFAMRYLTGSGKAVSRDEIAFLHAAGLAVGFVFESTANRSAQGRAAGVADAKAALATANVLGVPASVPLFFAVDFAASVAAVAPYFAGVRSVLGNRAGVYGSYTITTGGLALWRWQTMAWSGEKVDPGAHLIQQIRQWNGCDVNVLQHALPFWGPAPAAPAPSPAPVAAHPAPSGVRTPAQALAEIRSLALRKANIGVNDCLINAHDIYGIPSNGTPTAAEAWARARYKHSMDEEPTPGSFVFLTGGHTISHITGQPAGHVMIYANHGLIHRGWRYVWTPGGPPSTLGAGADSRWVKCRIKDVLDGWPGHTLAGWTEDIDGVHVPGLAPAQKR